MPPCNGRPGTPLGRPTVKQRRPLFALLSAATSADSTHRLIERVRYCSETFRSAESDQRAARIVGQSETGPRAFIEEQSRIRVSGEKQKG